MTENEIILTHILQCRPIDLVLHKPVMTQVQQEQYEDFKRRRKSGEPLQYILGTCNFMGLELAVNPAVLIPRPETEQLVDAALKFIKRGSPLLNNDRGTVPVTILDLGTGSGNIAIALAKFVPESKIVSIDISPQALEAAKENARAHKVEDRIEFIQDDILVSKGPIASTSQGFCHCEERSDALFDLIISNPPYIPTNQLNTLPQDVQKEPMTALDGGADGLDFYRAIIKFTPHLLRSAACLMMEFGDGQAEALTKLIQLSGNFSKLEIFQDLAGRDRIIRGIR